MLLYIWKIQYFIVHLTKLQTVQILESHQKNFLKTYSDYFLNWYNFTQKYNFAIFDAGLDAFQSLLSLQNKPTNVKKIENFVRASFDSTLRKSLEKEELQHLLENLLKRLRKWQVWQDITLFTNILITCMQVLMF